MSRLCRVRNHTTTPLVAGQCRELKGSVSTASPMTSAGRFSPLGPVGMDFTSVEFHLPLASPESMPRNNRRLSTDMGSRRCACYPAKRLALSETLFEWLRLVSRPRPDHPCLPPSIPRIAGRRERRHALRIKDTNCHVSALRALLGHDPLIPRAERVQPRFLHGLLTDQRRRLGRCYLAPPGRIPHIRARTLRTGLSMTTPIS